MERYLSPFVKEDLERKIILIAGPRQSGKTTLAKSLMPDFQYFNYDHITQRKAIKTQVWDRKAPLVILDELHKMTGWKRWLKGIYDVEGIPPRLLVTGSARMDSFRKAGDSLAGRFFQYRLHPIDIKETRAHMSCDEAFERIWNCSGFPEPFFDGKPRFYAQWQRSHLDIMLRQDLLDLATIRDIRAMEDLVGMLEERVGSTVSATNLARDLQKDPGTIRRWLTLLEDMYVIFRVTPYNKRIARSLSKEPKFYFYDSARVKNEAARLENMVACALLKEIEFLQDTGQSQMALHFLRNKDGQEIDFLVTKDKVPHLAMEVKWSDTTPSKHFAKFRSYLGPLSCIQIVRHLPQHLQYGDIQVVNAAQWLAQLDLTGY
jgi:predicted AAA+ superfamily ATPase